MIFFKLFSAAVLQTWGSCQIRKNCGCACAGNARNVFPATAGKWSRHASGHVRGARAVMHAGSLTSGFPWGRRWGKTSRHSPRMHNTQFYVSGKWSMGTLHVRLNESIIQTYRCNSHKILNVMGTSVTCQNNWQYNYNGLNRTQPPSYFMDYDVGAFVCRYFIKFRWCKDTLRINISFIMIHLPCR